MKNTKRTISEQRIPNVSRVERKIRKQINDGLYALAQAGFSINNGNKKRPQDVDVALVDNTVYVVPINLRQELFLTKPRNPREDIETVDFFNVGPDRYQQITIKMGEQMYGITVARRLDLLENWQITRVYGNTQRAYWERTCKNYELPTEI